jgi:hypothetical protein
VKTPTTAAGAIFGAMPQFMKIKYYSIWGNDSAANY